MVSVSTVLRHGTSTRHWHHKSFRIRHSKSKTDSERERPTVRMTNSRSISHMPVCVCIFVVCNRLFFVLILTKLCHVLEPIGLWWSALRWEEWEKRPRWLVWSPSCVCRRRRTSPGRSSLWTVASLGTVTTIHTTEKKRKSRTHKRIDGMKQECETE